MLRALRVLRSFSVTTPLGVAITVDPLPGRGDSGHLPEDLADLLEAAGEAARSLGSGLLLATDEVQDLPSADLAAVIAALHRCAQRSLPVVAAVAGRLAELVSDQHFGERAERRRHRAAQAVVRAVPRDRAQLDEQPWSASSRARRRRRSGVAWAIPASAGPSATRSIAALVIAG